MLDVGLPDFITSSVWVAHIVSEMNSFITNSTFSHDCTSLINIKPTKHLQTHNKAILADIVAFCKHNFWKIMIFSHRTPLLSRKHSNLFSTAEQIVRSEQKAEDQHNAPEKILNKQPRQYSYRNPENGVTDQSSHILSRPFFIFYDDDTRVKRSCVSCLHEKAWLIDPQNTEK